MANEIVNAVALARDPDFRDWVRAGPCFHARTVIAGNGTGSSRLLAVDTVSNSTLHLDRWVNVLSSDPLLCSVGSTVGTGTGKIGQDLLLAEIAATWVALATVLYPAA